MDPLKGLRQHRFHTEQQRSHAAVRKAMGRYNAATLTRNLDRVQLVGSLSYFGVKTAGTNSRDRVYVANRGLAAGYTQQYIEGVFHAEFSSILLRNHAGRFDAAAWNALNPEGFAYGKSGVAAIKTGQASTLSAADFQARGFVNQYATSTLENDFNAIVIGLFTGGRDFQLQMQASPALVAKAAIVKAFYREVAPGVTFAM